MSLKNKLCPICKINIIKNFYAKTCIKCRNFKGENNPNFKNKSFKCINCGKEHSAYTKTKNNLCIECYKLIHNKHTKCKKCGNILSKNKCIYCKKCYKGPITKRWNPNLSSDLREKGRNINPEYYQWRISVFERDNYTCQNCNDDKGGNLNAHHLNGFSNNEALRTNVNNGVTFCKKCHKDFHKIYGYKNNTKNQFEEFILREKEHESHSR